MINGLIIPCYNESTRLDIKSFVTYAAENKHNILCFVNDGSSDATRATLAEIKSLEHENVLVYNVSENCGKAKAVQLGALHLYHTTMVSTIGFIDADLSTDFKDYEKLVYHMKINKSLKVIYGSRANDGTNKIKRDFVRGMISKVIRYIILCITRLNIKDTQCGAKVFRREVIPAIFDREFKTRWLFDVEILLRLKRVFTLKRFREIFIEKPLDNWVHMDGSKLGMKDAIQIPLSLIRIGWIYNIKEPFKSGIVDPVKVVTLRLAGLRLFQVVMFLLFTILVSSMLLGYVKTDQPSAFALLLPFGVYLMASMKGMIKRLRNSHIYMNWRWIKGYINMYKRRFLIKD